MSKRTIRKYDKEFKLNAVKLYLEGNHSFPQLSQELGVPSATLAGWVSNHKQEGSNAFPGKGHPKQGDEEMKHLRKENECLRRQRDILKKALAIFSSPAHKDMSL